MFRSKDNGKSETLGATPKHPLNVVNEGWVEAGKLSVGAIIHSLDGQAIRVQLVEQDAQRQDTYNFEVADYHTYFVGQNGVWVHNVCFLSEVTQRMNADVNINNIRVAIINFTRRRATSLNSDDINELMKELYEKGVKSIVVNSGQIVEPTGRLKRILEKLADGNKTWPRTHLMVVKMGDPKNEFMLMGDIK